MSHRKEVSPHHEDDVLAEILREIQLAIEQDVPVVFVTPEGGPLLWEASSFVKPHVTPEQPK